VALLRKRRFLGKGWLDFNQVPSFFNCRIGFLTAVSAQELQRYDEDGEDQVSDLP